MEYLLHLLGEIVRALGGEFLQPYVEPTFVILLGASFGHLAATGFSVLLVLTIYAAGSIFLSRVFWRGLIALLFVARAQLVQTPEPYKRFVVALADINNDSFGGKKRALLRELLQALNATLGHAESDDVFRVELFNLPLHFALGELNENGQLTHSFERIDRTTRKWLRRCNADVLVWGEYQRGQDHEPGGLFLTYVVRATSTLYPRPYEMRGLRISDADRDTLREDMLQALIVSILSQVQWLTRFRNPKAVAETLMVTSARIMGLLTSPPPQMSVVAQAKLSAALGDACLAIGKTVGDVTWFRAAGTAYERAGAEEMQLYFPETWVANQANMGTVLTDLGFLLCDDEMFDQAVGVFFRTCLTYPELNGFDRLRSKIEIDLGLALLQLGRAAHSETLIRDALAAIDRAWELRGAFSDVDMVAPCTMQLNRGQCLFFLFKLSTDSIALDSAIDALTDALEFANRGGHTLLENTVERELGEALAHKGELERDAKSLIAAAVVLRRALTAELAEKIPTCWIAACELLAHTLGSHGMLVASTGGAQAADLLAESVAAYDALIATARSNNNVTSQALYEGQRANIEANVGVLEGDLGLSRTRD